MKKLIKRITIIMSLLLLISNTAKIAFAENRNNNSGDTSIAGSLTLQQYDKQGNMYSYELHQNEWLTIPLEIQQRSTLVKSVTITWATYNFYLNGSYLTVIFTPTTIGAGLVAYGFTGSYTNYYNGILYSADYPVNVFSSTIVIQQNGNNHITLSGDYKVLTDVIEVFSAFWLHGGIVYNHEESE